MVNPYLTGTCTLQDMPSFAWRTHPTLADVGNKKKIKAPSQTT
ncbi:hypothetical protein QUF54_01390 [Candidatus Marithioploca araucensis]|uniref:Uncharacterized protein n=1 Tax=Candidatus Marithioploca araucensis TaxID=70273 RepID=A0ABT7VQR5_9GAMM|nr:hypothetical protein [Candidatus Marithioploca araucensis]